MTAQIIDGTVIAARIREGIARETADMKAQYGIQPGLATVLVGDNPASQSYVKNKRKACGEVGIQSFGIELPADITQDHLLSVIRELNARPDVNGILMQLPLPSQIDESVILSEVALEKDVDGFNAINIGRLAMKGRKPLFVPATPTGVLRLLDELNVPIAGANAVVLGRSNIVGMPTALLLIGRDATVTVCHSRTRDLPDVLKRADILIAAAGRAEMVKGEWLKPGVVVIDVGTNPVPDPTAKKGTRLVGDVDFESAKEVAGMITKVPGGVGPMTICMLLENTLRAAKMTIEKLNPQSGTVAL
jgi:5,10-methylene-tetrahydrofolate dehydrogenase/methenyl tetrahydrofolate cyclohydrolase